MGVSIALASTDGVISAIGESTATFVIFALEREEK
jgi:hypothetical protein